MFELVGCGSLFLWTIAIIFFIPFVPNSRVRYYGCYLFYGVYVSILVILLAPVYIIVGIKNVENLRLTGGVLKHLTKNIGIKWELRGGEILRVERGAIIAANHQSILDILGMLNIWQVMGKCTAVAKKELIYYPPFGPVMWLAGLVYIDRGNSKTAYQKLMKATTLVLNNKTKLWLYPEGTRNRKGIELLPFKRGAFRIAIECQVPIIPVVYSPYYFINHGKKTFNRGKIIISVLEPISTQGLTEKDVDDLQEKTYNLMNSEYAKLKAEVKEFSGNSKAS